MPTLTGDGRSGDRRADRRGSARGADVLLVSDYLKGVVTRSVIAARSLRAAERRGTPLLVDPKIPHLDCYAGATLVTPNNHEAEAATHRRIRTDDDARAAALDFRERARLRGGADHARRAWHVAVERRRSKAAMPATAREVGGRDRRGRHGRRHARAGARRRRDRSPKPPSSPTTPRASSSASSVPPPSRARTARDSTSCHERSLS